MPNQYDILTDPELKDSDLTFSSDLQFASIKKGKKKKKGNETMDNKKEEGRRGRRVKGEGRAKERGGRNKEINS